jgi:small subunit ribosomal protein S7
MPRRAEITPRELPVDPVHGSKLVTQLINAVMQDGKKSTAERLVYDALAIVSEKSGKSAVEALEAAVKTVTPVLEVRSRRVGGANYQVPVEVPQRRARTLAIRWLVQFSRDRRVSLGVRWLVQAARKRSGKSMSEKLAFELVDAMNGLGAAVKRREDTHKMADANRAFSHFRW